MTLDAAASSNPFVRLPAWRSTLPSLKGGRPGLMEVGFSWLAAAFITFASFAQPVGAASPASLHATRDIADNRSAEADSRVRQEEQPLRPSLDGQQRLVGECVLLQYKAQNAPYRQPDLRADSERQRIARQYAQCRQLNRAKVQQVADLRARERREFERKTADEKTLARRQEERRQQARRQERLRTERRQAEFREQRRVQELRQQEIRQQEIRQQEMREDTRRQQIRQEESRQQERRRSERRQEEQRRALQRQR